MMSIFPNCVKNVRVQALSDSVKFSRRLMQKILELLNCDLPLKIRATEQSLHDRNKIAHERQVNNCDTRIDRDICPYVHVYTLYTPEYPIIFENFRGGGRTPGTPFLESAPGTFLLAAEMAKKTTLQNQYKL